MEDDVPASVTVFQVAGDSGFARMIYQETVSADTLIGRAWPSGKYWWRMRTYNVDGSVFPGDSRTELRGRRPVPGCFPPEARSRRVSLPSRARPGDLLLVAPSSAPNYKVIMRSSADGCHRPPSSSAASSRALAWPIPLATCRAEPIGSRSGFRRGFRSDHKDHRLHRGQRLRLQAHYPH